MARTETRVSVVIPTLDAASSLSSLVDALRTQTFPPHEIIVIDSASTDGTAELATELGCVVMHIARVDFNHGRTRNQAAAQAGGDVLVFMTQDALPAHEGFLEQLCAPIIRGEAVASYARQVATAGASARERFAREFNYPSLGALRTSCDVAQLGVGAYFFSNVAAAVRTDIFCQVGMFADDVIMNEDMLLCARLLHAGHAVAYCADARVWHAHAYSVLQVFRRYFDIGVFFARHGQWGELRTHRRGGRYVLELMIFLLSQGHFLEVFLAMAESGAKIVAFQAGLREQWWPRWMKLAMSMHRGYWHTNE